MARAIFSGAISFGLVTVPVKLYSATSSHRVSFHRLEKDTGERVRNQRVAEGSGEEVDYSDIVKGYEVDEGRYVVLTPEELESVEPGRSRTIEISDFVDIDEVDPVYWNKTYYLGPQDDVGAEKPFELLRRALESTGKVGIGQLVMRGKQYLATIRPLEDILALETMWFADEVRATDEVDNKPEDVEVTGKELGMAEQLIEALTVPWDPGQYRDTYHERVLELIEQKARGEEIVVHEHEEPPQVTDLMEALRASVEASRSGGDLVRPPSAGEAGQDLTQLSKDELYERASAADVPGRSKMSKEELVQALSSAA